MQTLLRRALREWERTILWASVVVLSLVVAVLLSRLAGDKAPSQVKLRPAHSPRSYLNEATAFSFLQPAPIPGTGARNPFAFSCRLPTPQAPVKPVEPAAADGAKKVGPTDPVPPVVGAHKTDKADAKVVPPPPKRSASILYRGLYSGARDATRQLAFVSTREASSAVTHTAVLAPGQKTGGVTVKRVTPAELVVAGPTGVEVSIAIGTQAQVALE